MRVEVTADDDLRPGLERSPRIVGPVLGSDKEIAGQPLIDLRQVVDLVVAAAMRVVADAACMPLSKAIRLARSVGTNVFW